MDQASKLRSAIIKKNSYKAEQLRSDIQDKEPRVICVSSGKGGVGKSNFTLNLALSLRKKGHKVTIIDADLGLANIEILLGITPKLGLLDLTKNNINIEDVIVDGPLGIQIISGGAGISEVVDLPLNELNKILNSIYLLKEKTDFILIDTGAGISKSVMSFLSASDEVIVVITPEPTAVTDGYALIKVAIREDSNKKINLVVNKCEDENEALFAYEKIKIASKKFLNFDVGYLGYICNDKNVQMSVKSQIPFYINAPNSTATNNIDEISNKILGTEKSEGIFNSFIKKLSNFFLSGRG
ncbi:flagellar biosynthesis protein FlhG [Alkalithermobacter thermoalcaliphilus JW-YL-7 = DSM 7308]|uniref:Cobyrinic acid ac-diamide synthase n=1 Tax=Alkalithermobacter thermoalcaliphilus JW-YL-7 = DSM 7308 TaxID=1121328 RepID=A0A150FQ89_CLOPD|nr:Cobyrinic acid ac-diamide synthase [[Clostridium] paradoxum JW-YL-7 = DSM 7308]SHK60544.1 flagellar biosynthesis protein FlhG [[Clostridium] paradoxum JW-YL-7 = DSM 7308]